LSKNNNNQTHFYPAVYVCKVVMSEVAGVPARHLC